MELNGVEIEDTFAEAFPIKIARILITGATRRWALVAAQEATGFGTSVIMCPAEAGIEKVVDGSETRTEDLAHISRYALSVTRLWKSSY